MKALKEARRLSLTEFSEELRIPRTTLQSVMDGGQTTLDTACRISDAVRIPLSALTDGTLSPERVDILHCWLTCLSWYGELSVEKQELAYHGFSMLLEALQK